jgi:hypothetical protein
MPNTNTLTETEKKFNRAISLNIPPFNWIPPEDLPLEETPNSRNSSADISATCKGIGSRKLQKSPKQKNPLDPDQDGYLELIPHPKANFQHPQKLPSSSELRQLRTAAFAANVSASHAGNGSARRKFEQFARLRTAFDYLVCHIHGRFVDINNAVENHASALLSPKDLKQPTNLVQKLTAVPPADTFSGFLWRSMPQNTQTQIRAAAGNPARLKRTLVSALNHLLKKSEVFPKSVLTPGQLGVNLPPVPPPSAVRGFNRQLLDAAYPNEIKSNVGLDPYAYHNAKEAYIALLQNVNEHEKSATVKPENAFGYGRNVTYMYLDPVIKLNKRRGLNLINAVTIVGEWIGYHISSSGVALPDKP